MIYAVQVSANLVRAGVPERVVMLIGGWKDTLRL